MQYLQMFQPDYTFLAVRDHFHKIPNRAAYHDSRFGSKMR
jgi:hypothetical protein